MTAETFRWSALRPGLLRELRDELRLGERKPELALAEAVVVPDDEFVKRVWSVLRDRWLATEATTRRSVVEALRARRLGDVAMKVGTAATDVAYLRSCKNSKALRSVVLAHLLSAGAVAEDSVAAKSPGARTRRQGSTGSATQRSEVEWSRFSRALALCLAQLEVDQFLILEARRHPDYYVRFAQCGPAGLRGESVSSRFLHDFERLSPESEARLRQLGWAAPAPEHEGEPEAPTNWHMEWPLPVPYPAVADLAVATLRSVYEVSAPAHLSYNAFNRSGSPVILPNLGIVRAQPAAPAPPAPATQAQPVTREVLLEQVKKVVAERIGADEIQLDDDGDIPLSTGTASLFIRVQPDAPVVSVFGALVWGFGSPPDILATVNDLNKEIRFARALWNGEGILLFADALGDPFDPEGFWNNVMTVAQLAEINIPKLQERYGGHVPFGPALPARQQPSAGYL